MSRTIWKFPLNMKREHQSIDLPPFSVILSAGIQNNALFIWVECDESEARVSHTVTVYGTGTGHEPYHKQRFISTVFYGKLVMHVYEVLI